MIEKGKFLRNFVIGSIGFSLPTIVLIILKLTEKINWSWNWVLSPLWIYAGLILGILLFGTVALLLYMSCFLVIYNGVINWRQ